MKTQVNLMAGETLTWAVYENGSGVLSLVIFAETASNARPVAAVFDILPDNVLPALDDLDMIDMWQGVNYDVADIHRFLRDEAPAPLLIRRSRAPGKWRQSWKLSAWDTPPARPSTLQVNNLRFCHTKQKNNEIQQRGNKESVDL